MGQKKNYLAKKERAGGEGMSFDPEEVVRCDPARGVIDPQGPYVSARDYDQLLALYREVMRKLRPRPIGGKDEDFCICGHHEMNHSAYFGMPTACNQTECNCMEYVNETQSVVK